MSVSERDERAGERSGRRRRRWSNEEKRRIVAETREPGASVASVARRHDLNANMLFTWRRRADQAEAGLVGDAVRFVPATITAEPAPVVAPGSSASAGRIEITLPGGERVVVGSDVDAAALSRVIKVLARR